MTLGLLPLLWPVAAAEDGERKVLWVLAGPAAEADGSARHIEVIPDRVGNEADGEDPSRYPGGLTIHLPEQGESEAETPGDAPSSEEAPAAGPVLREEAGGDEADRPLTLRERRARWRNRQGIDETAALSETAPVDAGEGAPDMPRVDLPETDSDAEPSRLMEIRWDDALDALDDEGLELDEEALSEPGIRPDEAAQAPAASRVSLIGMLAGGTESDTAPEPASPVIAGDASGDEGEPGTLPFEDEVSSMAADPGEEADMAPLPDEALSEDSADAADEDEGEEAEAALFMEGDEEEALPIEEESALAVEDESVSEDELPAGKEELSEEAPGLESEENLDEQAATESTSAEPTPWVEILTVEPDARSVMAERGDEPVPDNRSGQAEPEELVQDARETEPEEEPAPAEAALPPRSEGVRTRAADTIEPTRHSVRRTEGVTTAPARVDREERALVPAPVEERAPSLPAPANGPIEPAPRQGPDVARPFTLTAHIHRLEEVIMGGVQTGPLAERVDTMDTIMFGYPESGGLAERVAWLTRRVIRDPSSREPSLSTRLNMLEYHLINEIRQDAFTDRVERLETRVFDFHRTGPLEGRLETLEGAVHGDQAFELAEVVLPADTVFKISLNEDVGSKNNAAGDTIHFTVQEDVRQDGVLVLPRGAQGSGVVTKVTRPRMFGRSGEIEIAFNQVFSIDEEVIPTVLGAESRERLKMEAAAIGASAVGALALGPVGLVGGLFVKGREAELPAGTELYIQTSQAVRAHGIVPAAGSRPRRERPEDWVEDRSEDRPQPRTGRKEVVYAFAVDTQDDAS